MPKIRTLIIEFKNEIQNHEIPLFRGAIINSLENKLPLFHNHTEDGFRYGYPMIQYKRIRKKAALFCIGEGVDQVGEFFASYSSTLRLGERTISLEVDTSKPSSYQVQLWVTPYHYRVRKWIALNSDNYDTYEQLEGMTERIAFLENILVGNILSFSKGINLFFEDKVTCKITNLLDQRKVKFKGVNLLALDVEFKSNVSLPNYMGLGKGVSLNFGTLTRFQTASSRQPEIILNEEN